MEGVAAIERARANDEHEMDLSVFMVEQLLTHYLRLVDSSLPQAHFIIRNCMSTPRAQLALEWRTTQAYHRPVDKCPYIRTFQDPKPDPNAYPKAPWPQREHFIRPTEDYNHYVSKGGYGEDESFECIRMPPSCETITFRIEKTFADYRTDHEKRTLAQLKQFEEDVAKGAALRDAND